MPKMKNAILRFFLYFTLAVGWLWFYCEHPVLQSNSPFVYQDF